MLTNEPFLAKAGIIVLEPFCLESTIDMQGFEFFVGLERFLQSLTSPKTIRLIINPVDLMNQNMVLKWSSFHPHAATLELLRVHYDWTQSTATSTEQDTSDFRQLFETTSRLEQLAISGIEIDDDGKQYEFLNFLVSALCNSAIS